MLKAIETVYKGYKFRSRLEARWAVFFDALGITWEYEPDGYDLGRFGRYLPDFHLPQFDTIAEVKPTLPTTKEEDKLMTCALGLNKIPLFLVGTPGDEKLLVYCFDEKDSSAGEGWKDDFIWHITEEGYIKFWFDQELYQDGEWRRTYFRANEDYSFLNTTYPPTFLQPGRSYRRPLAAYEAARQARFEHGQNGA